MAYSGNRIVWHGAAITEHVRAGAAEGINRALEGLLAYAVPLTPFLNGDLSSAYGIHEATPGSVEEGGQLQNSSVYAPYQHEGGDEVRRVVRYTRDEHPDAGPKFVEGPMREHAAEFQQIIAASIAGRLR